MAPEGAKGTRCGRYARDGSMDLLQPRGHQVPRSHQLPQVPRAAASRTAAAPQAGLATGSRRPAPRACTHAPTNMAALPAQLLPRFQGSGLVAPRRRPTMSARPSPPHLQGRRVQQQRCEKILLCWLSVKSAAPQHRPSATIPHQLPQIQVTPRLDYDEEATRITYYHALHSQAITGHAHATTQWFTSNRTLKHHTASLQ